MPFGRRTVAWIEPQGLRFKAIFVAPGHTPATQVFVSHDAAKLWVEHEAEALGGLPIEWTNDAPWSATVV